MRKVLAAIAIMIILVISAAGCWDQRQINDLALVVATGMDVEQHQNRKEVVVTAQIANPTALVPGQAGGGGKTPAFWSVAGRGPTVRTAILSMVSRIPKATFFGQNRLIIFGEAAALSGVTPLLDRPLRSEDSRENTHILVSRGKAQEILELEMLTLGGSGLALNRMLRLHEGAEEVMPVTVAEFMYWLNTGVTSPVAPTVIITPETSVSSAERKSGTPPQSIKIVGLAVFSPEGRLLGHLDRTDTMGLMWVLNRTKSRTIKVACPVKGPREPVIVGLVRSKSRIIVHMEETGQPRFEIRVRTICDLWEHFGSHPLALKMEYMDSLERRVNTRVEQEILGTVRKAQEMNADVFGFGEEVRRQHHQVWTKLASRWSEVFPTVEVKVKSETSLRHRGLTIEPPGGRKESLLHQ